MILSLSIYLQPLPVGVERRLLVRLAALHEARQAGRQGAALGAARGRRYRSSGAADTRFIVLATLQFRYPMVANAVMHNSGSTRLG